MNKGQYNNIIFNTLKRESSPDGEPLKAVRKICNNLGVALPQGNCSDIYNTLKAGGYMAWKKCSAEEAQAAANSDIAAIAITENSIAIIPSDDIKMFTDVSNGAAHNAVAVDDLNMSADVAYYSYGTGVLTTENVTNVFSCNNYLNKSQMKTNAQYILSFLRARGWTKQSICGLLGNMEVESTINPGFWEDLKEYDYSKGFGLVQWTPASKYIDWADQECIQYDSMNSQLRRILYEVYANPDGQWIPTKNYKMSFSEFTRSVLSPGYLARVFIYNYERPRAQYRREEERVNNAEYWYKALT